MRFSKALVALSILATGASANAPKEKDNKIDPNRELNTGDNVFMKLQGYGGGKYGYRSSSSSKGKGGKSGKSSSSSSGKRPPDKYPDCPPTPSPRYPKPPSYTTMYYPTGPNLGKLPTCYTNGGSKDGIGMDQRDVLDAPNLDLVDAAEGPGSTNSQLDETQSEKIQRLQGKVPEAVVVDKPNIANPDPLPYAYCFNENYNPPHVNKVELYNDFIYIFKWGLANQMKGQLGGCFDPDPAVCDPENTNKVSGRNFLTNNRFPGMWLRMCFHDNAINVTLPDFQQYIHSRIDYTTKEFYPPMDDIMETSGLDASVLISNVEKYHPNQNYDKTASRIVQVLFEYVPNILDSYGNPIKMVDKYDISWADFLANGCLAAYEFVSRSYNYHPHYPQYPQYGGQTNYAIRSFMFGRHDACYVKYGTGNVVVKDGMTTNGYPCRVPLVGPTDNLPGALDPADKINNWFVTRGMSACLWLSLFGTHSMVDNTGLFGMITDLWYKTDREDMLRYLDLTLQQAQNPAEHVQTLWFHENTYLDYFIHHLYNGVHSEKDCMENPEGELECSCPWWPERPFYRQKMVEWPLTAPDCTLAFSNLLKYPGLDQVKYYVQQFGHGMDWINFPLKCALNVLIGFGISVYDDCYHLPCFDRWGACIDGYGTVPPGHKFGAYWSSKYKLY